MAYTNLNTKELVSDISKIDPNALYTDETGKTVTGKYVQGGYGNTINSSVLNPSPSPNFQSPTPTSIYPVSGLSQPEQKAQGYVDKVGTLSQGLLGESAYKTQQEQVAGLEGFEKTKQDLSNQLKFLLTKSQQFDIEAGLVPAQLSKDFEGRGATTGVLATKATGRIRDIALQKSAVASDALLVSANLDAAEGNIASALRKVDEAVAQKYDPIREEIAVATANLELVINSPEYSKAVKDRAQAELDRQDKLKRDADRQDGYKRIAQTMGMAAITNNPNDPQAALAAQQILELDDSDPKYLQKVFSIVGKYQTDPQATKLNLLKYQNEVLTNEKIKLDIAKTKNEIELNKPITGRWADVINGASGLVASTKQKTVKQNIANALTSENYTLAYAEIANSVSDNLTGTNKTKFDDARTDLLNLQRMGQAIQAYADDGGDLGLLTGKEEDIKRKLGIDTGKASALAVQLWREFQTYRSNMTGAAFTEKESRDYASVNPTLGKSLDLNLNVIQGATNQLEDRINSTINARIPSAQDIYDLIQVPTDLSGYQSQLQSGEILVQRDGQIWAILPNELLLTDIKL